MTSKVFHEHRSLLNRSGICEELSVVVFCFVHTAVLRIKTALHLSKVHVVFRIMLSYMFCFYLCEAHFLEYIV